MSESYRSDSEENTFELGKKFAERLQYDDVVLLYGDLGSGKTSFAKGVCSFFNVEDVVSSPTFTIINHYEGETPTGEETTIYHVDLYRVKSQSELEDIGFIECMNAPHALKIVEWSENAGSMLPKGYWSVAISSDDESDNQRMITISKEFS